MIYVHAPLPGIEPVSPALADGFFTTEPPGKSWIFYFCETSEICLLSHMLLPNHSYFYHYIDVINMTILITEVDLYSHIIVSKLPHVLLYTEYSFYFFF